MLSPIDNDKVLSPVEKYKALSPINKEKTSSSVDKYEVLSSPNKDTTSLLINNEARVNRGSIITQSFLDDRYIEKNMAKPSSTLTRS